jgi:hypothetical protein
VDQDGGRARRGRSEDPGHRSIGLAYQQAASMLVHALVTTLKHPLGPAGTRFAAAAAEVRNAAASEDWTRVLRHAHEVLQATISELPGQPGYRPPKLPPPP